MDSNKIANIFLNEELCTSKEALDTANNVIDISNTNKKFNNKLEFFANQIADVQKDENPNKINSTVALSFLALGIFIGRKTYGSQ